MNEAMNRTPCPVLTAAENLQEQSLDEVCGGRVLLVSGLLHRLGYCQQFASMTLETIEELAGSEPSRAIADAGFSQMHRFLTGPQMFALVKLLIQRLSPCAMPLVGKLFRQIRAPKPVFVAPQVWARIMAPEEIVASNRELFAGQCGHLIVHNPHRDSWFSQSANIINIWAAMGPVHPRNSVLIYPSAFKADLRRTETTIAFDQPIGRPVGFSMQPGDVLLFLGDHLHSSAINLTTETRYVLSMRITLGEPQYAKNAVERARYVPLG